MLAKSMGALAIVVGLGFVGAAYYSGVGSCPLRDCGATSECCTEESLVTDACPASCETTSACCATELAGESCSPVSRVAAMTAEEIPAPRVVIAEEEAPGAVESQAAQEDPAK